MVVEQLLVVAKIDEENSQQRLRRDQVRHQIAGHLAALLFQSDEHCKLAFHGCKMTKVKN